MQSSMWISTRVGFAGASGVPGPLGGAANVEDALCEFMKRKEAWALRVQQRLIEEERSLSTDPFEALAAALRVADEVASKNWTLGRR